eukprot:TRINITY_DN9861_c0_g1_i5.p1 TRINITY_DN9861_c0_g1~~TRINITY_DN9861_c0_g1_i5.p1  ORF type:complete len:106 (-),score=22.37 TRINITY_DN9861_c0_g1_i5:155-472(-)
MAQPSSTINYFSFKVTAAGYEAKSITQKNIIGGVVYETKDIYGMDSSDSAAECIVCLTEPKNTMLTPCNHACLCNNCAEILRVNKNLCPICRTRVDSYKMLVKGQ